MTFDERKAHRDPRRATETTSPRGQTPAGVVREIHAPSLARLAIRASRFEAVATKGEDPDRRSFTGCSRS